MIIELLIANLGQASAVNVEVSFGPVKPRPGEESIRTLSFARLLPDAKIRLSLGSYVDMPQKTITANIRFQDKFGVHQMRYEQNLELWLGLSKFSNKPEYAAAQSLSKIENTLRGWSSSSPSLKVETFTTRDRTQRDKDLQALWQKQSEDNSGLT